MTYHTEEEYTAALDAAGGNRCTAARALGVSRQAVCQWVAHRPERVARWPAMPVERRSQLPRTEQERRAKALDAAGGDTAAAARSLGLTRAAVSEWARRDPGRRDRWCRGRRWARKHTDAEYAAALDAAGGNRSAAARALGVALGTIIRWVRKNSERRARWPSISWRGFRSTQALDRGYNAALVAAGGDRRAAAEALGVSLATVHRWVRARRSRKARWNRRSR